MLLSHQPLFTAEKYWDRRKNVDVITSSFQTCSVWLMETCLQLKLLPSCQKKIVFRFWLVKISSLMKSVGLGMTTITSEFTVQFIHTYLATAQKFRAIILNYLFLDGRQALFTFHRKSVMRTGVIFLVYNLLFRR